MHEISFVTDLIEERLVKGKFRWLANFKEIRKDYKIDEFTFPIYATGGLEEKGFLLSRLFSTLVTPKYKTRFLFYTSPEINVKLLRKLVISCKNKFGGDDWIFIGLVQNKPIGKDLESAIENIADNRVGIAAYSLTSNVAVSSKNVLGKALQKQLKLANVKFEASEKIPKKQLKLTNTRFEKFDLPNYLKSFTIIFFLGTSMLTVTALSSGFYAAIQPITISLLALFSSIIGYQIYKTHYHSTLTLNASGFELREGKTKINRKWSDFKDLAIYITPRYETCLRLYSKDQTLDLPLSRVSMPRKEAYRVVRQLIKRE